jgi:hypothetical protein
MKYNIVICLFVFIVFLKLAIGMKLVHSKMHPLRTGFEPTFFGSINLYEVSHRGHFVFSTLFGTAIHHSE